MKISRAQVGILSAVVTLAATSIVASTVHRGELQQQQQALLASEFVSRVHDLREDYAEASESVHDEDRLAAVALTDDAISFARTGRLPERHIAALLQVRAAMERSAQPIDVEAITDPLVHDVLISEHVPRAPHAAPDLARGARIYDTTCAACHGADGSAETPVAAALHPHPASFLDAETVNGLSPFIAYQAVSFGVHGAAMPAFRSSMSEEDRWSVAFYVFTLRQPACAAAASPTSLETLAASSDDELVARFGEGALPCFRHSPSPAATSGASATAG